MPNATVSELRSNIAPLPIHNNRSSSANDRVLPGGRDIRMGEFL
jgi:hypothetical protein